MLPTAWRWQAEWIEFVSYFSWLLVLFYESIAQGHQTEDKTLRSDALAVEEPVRLAFQSDAELPAHFKVKVRLINKETGEVKEQEVFMGDFPIMTEHGT